MEICTAIGHYLSEQVDDDSLAGEIGLGRVYEVNMLGSRVEHDGGSTADTSARLRSAGCTWAALRRSVLKGRLIAPNRTFAISSSLVVSRLYYACESWTFSPANFGRPHSFYLACMRTITGISRWRQWQNTITNERVLELAGAPPLQALDIRPAPSLGPHRGFGEDLAA